MMNANTVGSIAIFVLETSVKPCEEEPTPPGNEEETTSIPPITSPSTTQSTTSLPSTTSPYICNVQGYQFRVKRKNGFWWCMFVGLHSKLLKKKC